ncbi:MAG: polyphosphate kinase 1 [Microscillaceae bacterium]|nr:polyphosphate kinase 1 [Microscillaceae bacterium]MDW8460683.1 polyphosphate kinase 1 [Cytophagales bacterium]
MIDAKVPTSDRVSSLIEQSNYISRDLSWLKFNLRVLEQAIDDKRTIFERLRFLAITGSNLDEFFMVRVGSLYNYIDYGKERIDYSGLREKPFRKLLLQETKNFYKQQSDCFSKILMPEFLSNGFKIVFSLDELKPAEKENIANYFMRTIFPMLTPMAYDNYRTFPILMNKTLIFGVVSRSFDNGKDTKKLSFVQIPTNIPRFYEFEDENEILIFVPIEEIIRHYIHKLYRNIEILSVSLFRITRNGDITLEESDDLEDEFLEEIKAKIKSRKTGRVVRIEIEKGYSEWMMKILKKRLQFDDDDIFLEEDMLDYTSLMQIANHVNFKDKIPSLPAPVKPIGYEEPETSLLEYLKHEDILLHHPYNSMELLIELLEEAAEDPNVLAIKITIYRLAKKSRITEALLKAAENGKHVSVLFELKARFDEENNIREAERLQKAGCYVIYGFSRYKTHTKIMLIVRQEENQVTRYVHLSSGNYNETTAKMYTDIALLTTNEVYAHDISEFFNAITGHSQPQDYKYLITAPKEMRKKLISLIRNEAENALQGLPSGIVIKINSLEDQQIIDELYEASKAGVPIRLIVRGICCLRPQRKGLSENIVVHSIIGDFLEHARLYYFHNNNQPFIYGGSADMMVRSFDRRIESLFLIVDENLKKQAISILYYNLKDNTNTYIMQEDGTYQKRVPQDNERLFNIHREFFYADEEDLDKISLF